MCDCRSVTGEGGEGGQYCSAIVLHVGGFWERHPMWGKCKCTVHCQWGGVMCYTKEGKDSRAYSFGFENPHVTGMGGFRLIACVRKNEKLRHGCN